MFATQYVSFPPDVQMTGSYARFIHDMRYIKLYWNRFIWDLPHSNEISH